MKSLSVKLGVILIGLLIFGYAEVWGADWKLYGDSEYYMGFYDAQNITHPSKNIVRVWTRWDYKEIGVIDYVRKFGEEYKNFSFAIGLWEINCVEKMRNLVSGTYYDNKGEVIYSSDSPSEWKVIIPGTMYENLYKEVCK